jgi:uncharacterized protein YjbI with pentapeptide repeats
MVSDLAYILDMGVQSRKLQNRYNVQKVSTLLVCITLLLIAACSTKYEAINGCEISPKTECPNIDLSDAVLSEANLSQGDLSGANLTGAVLSGANLIYTDLRESDLTGADLTTADLMGADLRDATLAGADFTGAGYNKYTQFPEGFDKKAAGLVWNGSGTAK